MTFGRSLVLLISLYATQTNAFTSHKLPSPRTIGTRGRSPMITGPPSVRVAAPIDTKTVLASSTDVVPASPLHEAFPMRTNPLLAVGLLGGLMCGMAGYLNAITFLQLGMTSMHVTGLMTRTSSSFVTGELMLFMSLAVQLVVFVLGSTIASVMVGGEQKFKGGQHHTKVLCLIASIVSISAALSTGNALLASSMITLCAGMQNGMTTFYSGAVVRSTHITGTLTDMGTETAQILMGRSTNPWKLQVLSAFALFYFLGGNLGSVLATQISTTYALGLAAAGYAVMAGGNFLFHKGKLRFFKRAVQAIWYPETVPGFATK